MRIYKNLITRIVNFFVFYVNVFFILYIFTNGGREYNLWKKLKL